MWPKCAFGDQKGLIQKTDHGHFAIPLIMGQQLRTFQKHRFFILLLVIGQKVGFWVKKWCFRVFWTECEVAGLKQRQRTTTMDDRNKIQSLVLPTDDPGDTPDCMCEYSPCTCECGHMCHTASTAQKYGFSLQPTLHLAFLVRLEAQTSMPATKYGQQRANRGEHPGGP